MTREQMMLLKPGATVVHAVYGKCSVAKNYGTLLHVDLVPMTKDGRVRLSQTFGKFPNLLEGNPNLISQDRHDA